MNQMSEALRKALEEKGVTAQEPEHVKAEITGIMCDGNTAVVKQGNDVHYVNANSVRHVDPTDGRKKRNRDQSYDE